MLLWYLTCFGVLLCVLVGFYSCCIFEYDFIIYKYIYYSQYNMFLIILYLKVCFL